MHHADSGAEASSPVAEEISLWFRIGSCATCVECVDCRVTFRFAECCSLVNMLPSTHTFGRHVTDEICLRSQSRL
jgi:hypothetical protein